MNRFRSAHQLGAAPVAAPTLSVEIGHVFGTTETLLAKPGEWARVLALVCEAGSFRVRPGDYVAKTFTADATANTIAITGHGLVTGDGPYQVSNSGGALPAGLAAATLYWVVKVDNDTLQLATSYANAKPNTGAPTVVDLTDAGTGTQTLGGVPAAPGASVATGYGSVKLAASTATTPVSPGADVLFVQAPDKITVKGAGASDILTYWWA